MTRIVGERHDQTHESYFNKETEFERHISVKKAV